VAVILLVLLLLSCRRKSKPELRGHSRDIIHHTTVTWGRRHRGRHRGRTRQSRGGARWCAKSISTQACSCTSMSAATLAMFSWTRCHTGCSRVHIIHLGQQMTVQSLPQIHSQQARACLVDGLGKGYPAIATHAMSSNSTSTVGAASNALKTRVGSRYRRGKGLHSIEWLALTLDLVRTMHWTIHAERGRRNVALVDLSRRHASHNLLVQL